MITSTTSGVWELDDVYAKRNAERWRPDGVGLFAFGNNANGQLGQNSRVSQSSPVQIPGTTWSSISSGFSHSLATKTDNTLWACGSNSNGGLGQNAVASRSSPVQIPGTTWDTLGTGYLYSFSTKSDGTLWSWGYNSRGQLGQNNTIQYSSPVQIPGTTWSRIEAGVYLSLSAIAKKTDGTLWSWGYNNNNELGLNDSTPRSSPTQIPGTTWNSINTGYYHSLATKTDGTLWSWGYNNKGQLGQNNGTGYGSPRQIPGTNWSSVSAGYYSSLATKTDGTLWSWGYNNSGQLGQNNITLYSSPVQIPGTQWSLTILESGYNNCAAIKNDNTLWTWGSNGNGQLGLGDVVSRSSPIQVPGTTWSSVGETGSSILATKNIYS